ncbi:hypothetical protein KAR91_25085 [Candidatus Pacearchaeota archaeon]|nr:hypothetical protein [Candidatus Pacearchaeota archaeon]
MNLEEMQAALDAEIVKNTDMQAALTKANGESKDRRLNEKELKDRLAAFDGFDAEELRGLKSKAAQLEQDRLKQAGQFDEALATGLKDLKDQLTAKDEIVATKDKALHNLLASEGLRNEFKGLVNNEEQALKLMLESVKVEDNKLVIMDGADIRLNDAGNPMNKAEFFSVWIAANPHFQVAGASGSGSQGNQGNNNQQGAKSVSRVDFNAMDGFAQAAHCKAGGIITD